MEIKQGIWCAYTIEDLDKTIRFNTKNGLRGQCDILIKDGKCYIKDGIEIETVSMEHLITISQAEYDELLEYKSMYEDLCE